MLNQDFSFKEFLYLVRRDDYSKYFKSENGSDMKDILLRQLEENINIEKHDFTAIKMTNINNNSVYMLEKICHDKSNLLKVLTDDFILRKINRNFKRIYGVKQADRFKIIKTVKNLLSENFPFFVCKADIHQFYESINRNEILKNIEDSSLLSYETKYLIKKFFSTFETSGLLRGINISATLSEYYMRNFDKNVRKIDDIFFYARYVDDIIIFSTEDGARKIFEKLPKLLPSGLLFNNQKTQKINFANGGKIQFLGYEFEKINKTLKTRISPHKIKKNSRTFNQIIFVILPKSRFYALER